MTRDEYYLFLREKFPAEPANLRLHEPVENTFVHSFLETVFRGTPWPEVSFPDESYLVFDAFLCMESESQIYYLPAYMQNSLENPYYESGCLYVLKLLSARLRDSENWTKAICTYLLLSQESIDANVPKVFGLLFQSAPDIRHVRKAYNCNEG